jgi:hypothetical protein
METLKLKRTVESVIEAEVKLPYFCKDMFSYYKVISEKRQVSVSYYNENAYEIQIGGHFLTFVNEAEYTTEEEFNEFYNKVKSLL